MYTPPPIIPGSINILSDKKKVKSTGAAICTTPGIGDIDAVGEFNKSINESLENSFQPVSEELMAEVYSSRLISLENVASELPGHVYSYLFSSNSGTVVLDGSLMILEATAGVDCYHTALPPPEDMMSISRFHKFYSLVGSSTLHKPGDKIMVKYLDENPRTVGVIIGMAAALQLADTSPSASGAFSSPGGSSPVGALAAQREANVKYPRRVVCLGDSITAVCSDMNHRRNNGTAAYAARLCGYSKKIKSLMGEGEVFKLGYVGMQTGHILSGKEGKSPKSVGIVWEQIDGKVSAGGFQVALRLNPSDLIIMAGVNDLASGKKSSTIINNLKSMYAKAKNAGIRVIALTIIPWGSHKPADFGVNGRRVKRSRWAPEYKKVNDFIRSSPLVDVVIDTEKFMGDTANPPALKKEFRRSNKPAGDQLHPNARGQAFLGELIYKMALKKEKEKKEKVATPN